MRFLFRLDLNLYAGAGKKIGILNYATKQGLSRCSHFLWEAGEKGDRPGGATTEERGERPLLCVLAPPMSPVSGVGRRLVFLEL